VRQYGISGKACALLQWTPQKQPRESHQLEWHRGSNEVSGPKNRRRCEPTTDLTSADRVKCRVRPSIIEAAPLQAFFISYAIFTVLILLLVVAVFIMAGVSTLREFIRGRRAKNSVMRSGEPPP